MKRSRSRRFALLFGVALALGGCVYYGPPEPYAGAGYYPGYYGPPVYGSVGIGLDFGGWHDGGWRDRDWHDGGWHHGWR